MNGRCMYTVSSPGLVYQYLPEFLRSPSYLAFFVGLLISKSKFRVGIPYIGKLNGLI